MKITQTERIINKIKLYRNIKYRDRKYKRYFKLLILKYCFKKNSKLIINNSKVILYRNKKKNSKYLNEREINNMISTKYYMYKTIHITYYTNKPNICFKINVNLLEYLQIKYKINKYNILNYINNNNNWFYPKFKLIKTKITHDLFKNNIKNISKDLEQKLFKIYNKKYYFEYPMEDLLITDLDFDWHIDCSYNDFNKKNDILVISQSNYYNLGTEYYEIARLKVNLLFKDDFYLNLSILRCCNELSILFLKKNKRICRLPENILANIPNQVFHRTPNILNKPYVKRTVIIAVKNNIL